MKDPLIKEEISSHLLKCDYKLVFACLFQTYLESNEESDKTKHKYRRSVTTPKSHFEKDEKI